MSTPTLEWIKVNGFEHLRPNPEVLLRISFQNFPYSYGTTSVAYLELLTSEGWQTLLSVEYKSRGTLLKNVDEVKKDLKNYAAFLYPQAN